MHHTVIIETALSNLVAIAVTNAGQDIFVFNSGKIAELFSDLILFMRSFSSFLTKNTGLYPFSSSDFDKFMNLIIDQDFFL